MYVPSSENTRFDLISIELADGSGVIAQLGVFHALLRLRTSVTGSTKIHTLATLPSIGCGR